MVQSSLTLLSWCYANQNTHPSPGLYLALPPQRFPQNSKRSRNSCGIGREVMWGSHFRKSWEGRGVSFKWHSERLPQGGKEPGIFLGGLSLHKSSSGGTHLISLLFPCALYALLPTGSRQRTVNSGLSILAVLPKYSCDIEMGNWLLILAFTSNGNSGKTTEQSFKRFKCIPCSTYINCSSVTATEKIVFPTTTNKRQRDAKRAFFVTRFKNFRNLELVIASY